MMPRLNNLAALACLLVSAPGPVARPAATPVLKRVADVPLPGPPVRFDYQSIDTTAHRLYISHMNAGELVVFNLANRSVEATVTDLPKVTGVWAVPALGKIYASVPGKHHIAVIDARTLRVDASVGDVGFPDGIAYAPDEKKIYVSDESGGGELVIDGVSNRVITAIPLGGEAGNTIFDPGSRRIQVAVQTRNEVVEIDPHTDRVVARHALAGAVHPHGLSIDPLNRLLFVANEGNATLVTVDLRNWQVTGTHEVGGDPDVLAFDAEWRRLYVASESGRVSVFTERNGRLIHEGDITIPQAHTVSVDPRTHLVYFPLQNIAGRAVLRVMAPRQP